MLWLEWKIMRTVQRAKYGACGPGLQPPGLELGGPGGVQCEVAAEVTVLIPTYNRAALLARSVDCALAQTYPNCRVLIIDDGSTDATGQVVAARYGSDPRVRCVRQENRGVAAARNLGLSLATGRYVAFLDSDDVWKPWKIEVQVACLERLPGVGMIWTDMDCIEASGELRRSFMRKYYGAYGYFERRPMFEHSKRLAELAPMVKDPGLDTRVFWGDVFSAMVMGNLCLPSTVLVLRDVALAAGGFDESMLSGEDHDFHLRLSREAPLALLDAASTVYRRGTGGQLTDPAYQPMIARNALRTILPVIRNERGRIRLPGSMIRRKLAHAHKWIAQEALGVDNRTARRHFFLSLWQWPWQGRTWLRFASSLASPKVSRALRAAYGRFFRPEAAQQP